jgi:hypothetical protein
VLGVANQAASMSVRALRLPPGFSPRGPISCTENKMNDMAVSTHLFAVFSVSNSDSDSDSDSILFIVLDSLTQIPKEKGRPHVGPLWYALLPFLRVRTFFFLFELSARYGSAALRAGPALPGFCTLDLELAVFWYRHDILAVFVFPVVTYSV